MVCRSDGQDQTSPHTGLAANEYGWWYVSDGQVDFNCNGLVNSAYGWWYVSGGRVDDTYTDL